MKFVFTFSASALFIGWQEGHQACKTAPAPVVLKRFSFENALVWSNPERYAG